MHVCAGGHARRVFGHWVRLVRVLGVWVGGLLELFGLFFGFVFLMVVVAEFEDFDGEEGHVGSVLCGYTWWLFDEGVVLIVVINRFVAE